ncbi:MAG: hypothetical protein V1821_02200 [bacterium]
MSKQIFDTEIQGAKVELQPIFGNAEGGVLHMLPGGVGNPEGFGNNLLDIYAFTAVGRGKSRGGHYHLKLEELFFQLAGTALWILSDFRPESPTFQKTIGVILGVKAPTETHGLPVYTIEAGTLPRLRIPAGVYHAIFPLDDERVTSVALGSTAYDAADYQKPELQDVPGAKELLNKFNF